MCLQVSQMPQQLGQRPASSGLKGIHEASEGHEISLSSQAVVHGSKHSHQLCLLQHAVQKLWKRQPRCFLSQLRQKLQKRSKDASGAPDQVEEIILPV